MNPFYSLLFPLPSKERVRVRSSSKDSSYKTCKKKSCMSNYPPILFLLLLLIRRGLG
jgi:hypothetical protein